MIRKMFLASLFLYTLGAVKASFLQLNIVNESPFKVQRWGIMQNHGRAEIRETIAQTKKVLRGDETFTYPQLTSTVYLSCPEIKTLSKYFLDSLDSSESPWDKRSFWGTFIFEEMEGDSQEFFNKRYGDTIECLVFKSPSEKVFSCFRFTKRGNACNFIDLKSESLEEEMTVILNGKHEKVSYKINLIISSKKLNNQDIK